MAASMIATPLTSRNLWKRSPTPTTVCRSSVAVMHSSSRRFRQSGNLHLVRMLRCVWCVKQLAHIKHDELETLQQRRRHSCSDGVPDTKRKAGVFFVRDTFASSKYRLLAIIIALGRSIMTEYAKRTRVWQGTLAEAAGATAGSV